MKAQRNSDYNAKGEETYLFFETLPHIGLSKVYQKPTSFSGQTNNTVKNFGLTFVYDSAIEITSFLS